MSAVQRGRTAGSTAADRKKQAAAMARAKAQESQNKKAGKGHLKSDIDILRPKDGARTLLSVIPYIVKERHHPDGVEAGQLWYKRPYKLHNNLGAGDEKKRLPCPNTFNPRHGCGVCTDIGEQVKALRDRKKSMSEDEFKKEMDAVTVSKGKNRDLMLVWDHDAKQLFLIDEPYGGGNMVGFGMLLDARLANPRQEDWAAFWLDGDDGMALDIQWKGAGLKGDRDWIKPISIDFIPRKDAPVPKEVWGKALELSDLLHHTTPREIEGLYFELPDDDEGISQEEQPEDDPPANEEETIPEVEEEEPAPEPDEEEPEVPEDEDIPFDLDSADKDSLLQFAAENELKDSKGRDIAKSYIRNKEENVRKVVKRAWEAAQPKDEPEEKPSTSTTAAAGKCPVKGGKFGTDYNELDGCKDCPDEIYNACGEAN